MSDKKNLCALCNNVAKQKCSACKQIYYCNREHQKMHWKIHSKNCQPCKIAVNAQLGRHFIATRDIKVGEVVLYEKKPLVSGPFTSTPMCLSCGDFLSEAKAKPCVKCGWPLCLNCKKHGAECDFTLKHRQEKVSITEYEKDWPIYKTILLVRALALRESNPRAYSELSSLEDHWLEIVTKPNILDPPMKMAALVKDYYKYEDIAELEIAKLAAKIQINGHATDKPKIIAVYGKSSYVEHNCRANCSKSFNGEGGIIHWAAVPISKGDHISISYVDTFWSTIHRKRFLAHTKFFDCICERCNDPTEFGTMFSAFKCIDDKCTGFMLPTTFSVSKSFPDFVCRECNATQTWESIDELETALEALLPDSGDEDARDKFLESYGRVLHENHFIKVFLDLRWIGLNDRDKDNSIQPSEQLFSDQIPRIKQLIELVEILAPADHGLRGSFTLSLHQMIISLRLEQSDKKKFKSSKAELQELKELREKAFKLLRYDLKAASKEMYEIEATARLYSSMLDAAQL